MLCADVSNNGRSILDRAGWPISQKTVKLMSDEIELGELYLTQSAQLREHMNKSGEMWV